MFNFFQFMFRYYYKFDKMAPSTGKWKVMMTSLTAEEYMEILKVAKERQKIRPRNLEIKFDIRCCHVINSRSNEGEHGFKDCLERKKILFRDWAEYITSLKMEILGNERFLLNEVNCPKLESLAFEIYPTRINQIYNDIICEFTKKHAHGLKCLEIIGDFKHPSYMYKFYTYMPRLEHCKLANLTPDDMDIILSKAHKSLVSLEIEDQFFRNEYDD